MRKDEKLIQMPKDKRPGGVAALSCDDNSQSDLPEGRTLSLQNLQVGEDQMGKRRKALKV